MKIILVGTAYPYRGGLAAFNQRLAEQLQAEGDEVSIETFTLQYPNFLFPGKTQFSNGFAPNLVINRSINSINPLNWLKIGKQIANKQPNVVIFAYWLSFMAPCFGSIARIIKNRCKATCIGLIHNMLPHEPSIIDKLLSPYFVNSMNSFVALSDSVAHDIRKFDKKEKNCVVSPHPIYDHYGNIIPQANALELLGLPTNKKYLLFFGFIRHYKGLDLLLQAMADERIRQQNVHLIVAGEFYGNEQHYKQLASELNLDNISWFSNYIPDNEVNRYFCAADFVVQPYKTATQSGVTQIGYHFEKPMLVTNVGGLAEIIPHEKVGYVVEPTPQAVANGILQYFEQQPNFTQNIRTEKQKYSWETFTQRIRKNLFL